MKRRKIPGAIFAWTLGVLTALPEGEAMQELQEEGSPGRGEAVLVMHRIPPSWEALGDRDSLQDVILNLFRSRGSGATIFVLPLADGSQLVFEERLRPAETGEAFAHSGLQSFCIPAAIERTFEPSPFDNCPALTFVSFEADPRLTTRGRPAFAPSDFAPSDFAHSGLSSMVLPAASERTFESSPFDNCPALTSVIFEADPRLVTIGGGEAFAHSPLASRVIPARVETLEIPPLEPYVQLAGVVERALAYSGAGWRSLPVERYLVRLRSHDFPYVTMRMDEEVPRGGFVIGCQSPFIPGIWLVDPESGVVPVGRYLVGFPNASPVFIPEYKKVPKGGRVIGHQAPGFCIRLLNLRDGEVLVGEYYVWCPQHNIRYSIRVCDPVPEGDVIFGYRYPCPNATPIESRLASLVT